MLNHLKSALPFSLYPSAFRSLLLFGLLLVSIGSLWSHVLLVFGSVGSLVVYHVYVFFPIKSGCMVSFGIAPSRECVWLSI